MWIRYLKGKNHWDLKQVARLIQVARRGRVRRDSYSTRRWIDCHDMSGGMLWCDGPQWLESHSLGPGSPPPSASLLLPLHHHGGVHALTAGGQPVQPGLLLLHPLLHRAARHTHPQPPAGHHTPARGGRDELLLPGQEQVALQSHRLRKAGADRGQVSTVQYSTVQYTTVHYSAVQCTAVLYYCIVQCRQSLLN